LHARGGPARAGAGSGADAGADRGVSHAWEDGPRPHGIPRVDHKPSLTERRALAYARRSLSFLFRALRFAGPPSHGAVAPVHIDQQAALHARGRRLRARALTKD